MLLPWWIAACWAVTLASVAHLLRRRFRATDVERAGDRALPPAARARRIAANAVLWWLVLIGAAALWARAPAPQPGRAGTTDRDMRALMVAAVTDTPAPAFVPVVQPVTA